METFVLQLTIDNPLLAGLTARQYSKSITDVPNDRLPADMVKGLALVYEALGGGELPSDGNTMVVAAQDTGTAWIFSRLYLPKVYRGKDENTLNLRWGTEDIPLVITDDGIKPANPAKGYKLNFSFNKLNVSGRGEDSVLNVSVVKDKVLTRMPLAIAVKDIKSFDPEAANGILSMEPTSLYDTFAEPSSGGGKDFEGPMVDLRGVKDELVESAYFTEEQNSAVIPITDYKVISVQGGTRKSCLLQSPGCDVPGLPDGPFHFWGNNRITNGLLSEPKITPDCPSEIVLIARGAPCLVLSTEAIAAQSGSGVDLNF